MTKALLVVAALGFTLSAAGACELMRSAKIDSTVVAGTTRTEAMSVPETVVPDEQAESERLLIEEEG